MEIKVASIVFIVLALAAILAILKPRYVQYCYYVLALAWFFVMIRGLLLKSVLLVQVNPYVYRFLPKEMHLE
jgi:putative exporter of polyketide antibiotics